MAVIPGYLTTRLIPQKAFDGVTWAEVFHEMDEGTRSPDRANDGVRSIGDRQDAGGREDGRENGTRRLPCSPSRDPKPSARPQPFPTIPRPFPTLSLCWRRRRPPPRRQEKYQETYQEQKYRGRYRGRLLLRVLTCGRISSPRSGRGSPISAPIRSGSTASARPIAARPWRRSMHLSGKASSRRVRGSRPRTQNRTPRHPHDVRSRIQSQA